MFTHYKKFKDCERLLEDFYTTIRQGLREKQGAVLFQLPPQLVYSDEMLKTITGMLDPSFENVIEFRHASWWVEQVKKELRDVKASFCGISYPGLPGEVVVNNDIIYYRFHGVPRLYYSEYTNKVLLTIAKEIGRHRGSKKAYIYFNNTASTAAITNAEAIQKIISQLPVEKKARQKM